MAKLQSRGQMMPPEREAIKVIGLDCDDPHALERLLRGQRDILRQADMICGGNPILKKLRHDPELSGKLLPLAPPLGPLYESLFSLRNQGLKVVVLADGDPLFHGIGGSLSRRIRSEGLVIKPAISCLQAACARLNLPWDNVYCLSLHGREDIVPLYDAIASGRPICILTGGRATPDSLARLLLDRGVDWFNVHIFERMGEREETVYHMSLKECGEAFFGEASTIVLTPARESRAPRPGLDEKCVKGGASFNKTERGAILELLNVNTANTVWIIGAGSRVLALEVCALAHEGRVIAIEKDADKCMDIQQNRNLFGAVNLDICCGEAPGCLAQLPLPQRIFTGIDFLGNKALETLEKCIQPLPPGGRLVAACKSRESLKVCCKFMEYLGWPIEIHQIQASTMSISDIETGMAEVPPVFLLAISRP